MVQGKTLYNDASEIPATESFVAVTGKTRNLHHLRTLTRLQTLWIADLKQGQVSIVGELSNLRTLCIRGTRAEDFNALAGLSGLQVLIIDNATRLTDLSFITELKQLRAIHLFDMKSLTNLAPLCHLGELVELHLLGGIWSKLGIESLEPLQALKKLRYLRLAPSMKEPTLKPLAGLTQLVELSLNNTFPMEEYAKLRGKLPNTKSPNFDELLTPFPHKSCRKCGEHTMHIPIGKGEKMLCGECDEKKIEDHVKRFNQIAQRAKVTAVW